MNRRSLISLGLGALAGCGGGGSGGGGSGGGGGGNRSGGSSNGAGARASAAASGRRGTETEFRDFLQVGAAPAYWIHDNTWGADGLTRGTYTGPGGTQFETTYSRSTTLGPNGEVGWRTGWKFPTGTTEVKAFLSAIFGSKPGYANEWVTPGGHKVLLPDNSYSTTQPSGATPGSFLPVGTPADSRGAWPDMFASFAYAHVVPPTGRGQLAFDLWLQATPAQVHGWGASPITHEVMIALDYWGNYGAPSDRNPGWFSHNVTIDGRRWHVYFVRHFMDGWAFIVFEPDGPVAAGTLNLGAFLRHVATRTDAAGQPWLSGTEWLVSIEVGVEPVEGVGDLSVFNYRVWRT
ncbi:hypothetical protein GCM10027034_28080 [Ramlibacter solisilvae]|uniref:Uncharacterized protein n=1 Tax=Ramlibacter tataouinensis TaxID=94132 RepID=A0A127JR54_9BURK|nr:hypothetical protein [Ramlibacter tataouinensis]AMO22450.1 hypothetical protein UC35_05460 [Ramlibacter tataouinensis]